MQSKRVSNPVLIASEDGYCYQLAVCLMMGIPYYAPLRNLNIKWSVLEPEAKREVHRYFMERNEKSPFVYVAIRTALETWTLIQDTAGAPGFNVNFTEFTGSAYVNSLIRDTINEMSNKVDFVCSGPSSGHKKKNETHTKVKPNLLRAMQSKSTTGRMKYGPRFFYRDPVTGHMLPLRAKVNPMPSTSGRRSSELISEVPAAKEENGSDSKNHDELKTILQKKTEEKHEK